MDGAAKCRAERLSAEPVLWRLTLWPRVRIHSTRRRDLRRCEGIDARGVDAHVCNKCIFCLARRSLHSVEPWQLWPLFSGCAASARPHTRAN